MLKEVANQCAGNYHPLKLMSTLGLASHPDIAPAVAASSIVNRFGTFELLGSTRLYDRISKQIVYHLDSPSQFAPVIPAFVKKSSGGDKGGAASLENLQQQLLLDKFRQLHTPGTFYTLRKADVADVLATDCLPVLQVNPRPQVAADTLGLQADGDMDCIGEEELVPAQPAGPACAAEREFIAFQVLNIKPAARKYALCDTSKELAATDVAVSQHRILKLDTVEKELEVSMEPVSDMRAWSRVLTPRALRSCYAWNCKAGSLTVVLPDSLIEDAVDVVHCQVLPFQGYSGYHNLHSCKSFCTGVQACAGVSGGEGFGL